MAKYQVETDKGTYEVETEDKSLGGLAENAVSDTGQIASGLGQTVKKGALDLPMSLTNSLAQKVGDVVTGQNSGDTPIEKEITNFGNNSPEMGKQMIAPVVHPLDYAYEHPVSQALNVLGMVEGPTAAIEGAADTGAQYAGRFGENQMGKLHGTSAAQFRQLGREGFSPTMRASYDMGDANLGLGKIGREQAVNERVAQLGSDLGDVREQAGTTGPQLTPQEMADQIHGNLKGDYAPGGKNFEDQGSFEKNIQNIQQMPQGGVEAFAQRASEIKRNANKGLLLPANAETDVANQMSHINDETIKSNLPPDIGDHYDSLKEQFGYAKNLQPMELRGEGKEAVSRGSNTAFGTIKDLAHSMVGGPKMGAQVGFGAESALESVAKAAPYSSVGALTRHIMSKIQSDPQSLGQFAQPLMKAAQDGGSQGLAAMHYILSTTQPAYNEMMQQ